jgi:hypothetical protein
MSDFKWNIPYTKIIFLINLKILEKSSNIERSNNKSSRQQTFYKFFLELSIHFIRFALPHHANNSVWTRNFRGKIPWHKKILGIYPKFIPRTIRLQWNWISEFWAIFYRFSSDAIWSSFARLLSNKIQKTQTDWK